MFVKSKKAFVKALYTAKWATVGFANVVQLHDWKHLNSPQKNEELKNPNYVHSLIFVDLNSTKMVLALV